MSIKCLTVLASLLAISWAAPEPITNYYISDEYIDFINTKAKTWQAGKNFENTKSISEIKQLMGTILDTDMLQLMTMDADYYNEEDDDDNSDLPENFDSRQNWPNCTTMTQVRDQGACGSCWAFGAAEAMSDRLCVKKGINVEVSAEDLLSCCEECGYGCRGGYPVYAWEYWNKHGVVSGGEYNTTDTCRPYTIPQCAHTESDTKHPSCDHLYATPECKRECQSEYKTDYEKDKSYGGRVKKLSGEKEMKKEIYKNGPIEGVFLVFMDFVNYKSGVYQKTPGSPFGGGHAIKILGWGVEDGTPYWLCTNSWNELWGDNGYFKILRGKNHCGIETNAYAGDPK